MQEGHVVGRSQLGANIVAVIFVIYGKDTYFINLDFRKLHFSLFFFIFVSWSVRYVSHNCILASGSKVIF